MGTHGNCYKVVSSAKPLLNRVPLHDKGQPMQLLSTCACTASHVLLLCDTGDIESVSLAPDGFDGTATPTAKASQTCGSYHVVLNALQHVRKRVSQCNVAIFTNTAQSDLRSTSFENDSMPHQYNGEYRSLCQE